LVDTPVNMTVILFTPAGMLVKSIEVPEVLACAVARVTREPEEEVQADPLEVSTFPLVPAEVSPVPPFAAIKVPARVTAPVVPVEGVKPVDPAEKEDTAPETAAEVQIVPLDVRTLPVVPGATDENPVPPELPMMTLLAVTVAAPVPPDVTARGVVRVADPALKAAK
jgi:hypothetical protein